MTDKPKPSKWVVRQVYKAAGISPPDSKGKIIPSPLFPPNGLSITERYFHRIPQDKNQVIMAFRMRLRLPSEVQSVTLDRIVDIVRLAQAKHFRLSAIVDYDSQEAQLLAKNAAQLQLLYRFVSCDDLDDSIVWKQTLDEEMNARFDLHDKPLWRVAIVGPSALKKKSTASVEDTGLTIANGISFDIVVSFNHCIGDGLSLFAFAQSVFQECKLSNFTAPSLDLANVSVSSTPPPLLDNLINPSFFGVFWTGVGLWWQYRNKTNFHKFKQYLNAQRDQQVGQSLSRVLSINLSDQSPRTSNLSKTHPEVDEAFVVVPKPMSSTVCVPGLPTQSHVVYFTPNEVAVLRKTAKTNGTTIASLLVVIGLYAVRVAFESDVKKAGKKLPTHQGYVVTSSMRHLVPGSKLLQGGSKEKDPSVMIFGGYASNVTDSSFKIGDGSKFWERCRAVRRYIGGSFFKSMRRMKLANWIYRHPAIFKYLRNTTDVGEMSRAYSLELANLGSWEQPDDLAPFDAPDSDTRPRLLNFGGGLNASFSGVRSLFTLGVITVGGLMSVTVTYDQRYITHERAVVFAGALKKALDVLKRDGQADTSKIKLVELFNSQ